LLLITSSTSRRERAGRERKKLEKRGKKKKGKKDRGKSGVQSSFLVFLYSPPSTGAGSEREGGKGKKYRKRKKKRKEESSIVHPAFHFYLDRGLGLVDGEEEKENLRKKKRRERMGLRQGATRPFISSHRAPQQERFLGRKEKEKKKKGRGG